MNNEEIINVAQCPECAKEGRDTAMDNLTTFQSGIQYCVAGHGTLGKSEGFTVSKMETVRLYKDLIDGITPISTIRGISPKTFEFYGYQINKEKGCHIANYFNESGQVVMQQLRDSKKNFPLLGDHNYNSMLYGSWLYTSDERVFITITEGQLDCLSVAEAFDCKYPVVSLPNGVQAAYNVLQKNLKYLNGFKYVILAFDNDGPGQEAINNCLKLFEPGKLRIVKWTLKDANEHLKAQEVAKIRQLIYGAVEYIPDPILTGQALVETLDHYSCKTKLWPWKTANRIIAPIQIPAIYTLAARPGVGKTEFVSEIMRDTIQNGGKVGVIALEQTIQQVLLRITSQITGTNLSKIKNRDLTAEEKELCHKVASQLVIYDHLTHGSSLDTIIDNLPYMTAGLGCEYVIFDNVSYSATSVANNERIGIDKAMTALKDCTVKYNFTLWNVCHLKREDGEITEGVSVDKIRGSQGIEMFSDYVLGLERNTSSENPTIRNTLIAHVLKDRMTGLDTGRSFKMSYNPETRRFEDNICLS
jgi:twinkle protein